jgi:transcriptional regulator with XRE-family HTH domain
LRGGEDLYDRFRQIIEKKGITSYKVSKETGISQVTLSDWKAGRSQPKLDKLQKIAKYLGVKIEDLIG